MSRPDADLFNRSDLVYREDDLGELAAVFDLFTLAQEAVVGATNSTELILPRRLLLLFKWLFLFFLFIFIFILLFDFVLFFLNDSFFAE